MRNHLYRLLLLLLLDIVLLVAFVSFIWFDNAINRGITYTPDPNSQPIAWADAGPQIGVNVFNLHLEPDPTAVTRTLQLADELGVRYVRIQIPWEDIEIHEPGSFEDRRHIEEHGVISAWEKYDRIVALANRLDIELIARLDRPPDWAREEARQHPAFLDGLERDPSSTGPPDNFGDYSAFVYAVVSRYRDQVRFFQIWNEPNLKNEWNWEEPSPEAFTRLLRFGYAAAKEANPDAVILFPTLAPVDGLDKRAPMTEMEYLDRVYKAGGKEYFDVMSAQSYGLGQSPQEHRYVRLRPFDNWTWTRPIDTRADVSRVVLLREVMERHGDSNKAIWISEFGWNSAPDTIPAERRFTWGPPVSEQQKAEYIIEQVERARNEWPWVGVMNIWVLRYGGYLDPDPADPTPYFALVQRNWSLLPAYQQVQTYLEQPAVAGVGAHSWQHPAVEPLDQGQDEGQSQEQSWRLRFSGSRATLVGGLDGDLLQVTLDGQPVNLIRDGTTSGEQTLTTPLLERDFSEGDDTHILEIVAPGSEPPDRFVVARDRPVPWFWQAAPVVLIVLLLVSGPLTLHALFHTIERLSEAIVNRWFVPPQPHPPDTSDE
jgi:hypothetical protein